MKNELRIAAASLILVMAAGYVMAEVLPVMPVSQPGMMQDVQQQEFKKLVITPKDNYIQLEPGKTKEFTVTVKNKETESMATSVHVEIQPMMGSNTMDKSWISVTPLEATIPSGGTQKYTVKVSVPSDASNGYYPAMVAFTNETIGEGPYGMPFKYYPNALNLNINVWTPPKIVVLNSYIYDRVKAADSYEYTVQLRNNANSAISINPELDYNQMGGYVMYNGGYGGPQEMPQEWVTISAPSSVPAKSTANVTVKVNVPADARGQYVTGINLNIDDPSIDEYSQRVQLTLDVWESPTEPFTKTFTVPADMKGGKLKIEVSASQYPYNIMGPAKTGKPAGKPTFQMTLTSPDGTAAATKVTKIVQRGSANPGMSYAAPPWEARSAGVYSEGYSSYSETYVVSDIKDGTWKLGILPGNVEMFDYTIEIEG
ncbi:MAG TPA: hypothetical protein HA257_05440 [Candidatus Methanoperedenaceae archaeon]|nr:hypothetical protein [Candidatus Methanoperedenaceae archaeon]